MDAATKLRLENLERRLAAAELVIAALKNLEIAPESGGGRAIFTDRNVVLRIDGLTPSATQRT